MKSEAYAACHEILIIIIIIMMSSLMCYVSKLEPRAQYKAKNKIHSKQTSASTRRDREIEREREPSPSHPRTSIKLEDPRRPKEGKGGGVGGVSDVTTHT